ncbi:MAG: hypothetical protein V2A62_03140 [Candidatus Woesearchaeota archaeon]
MIYATGQRPDGKRILALMMIVLTALLLIGCSTLTIKEAKTEQYIGKTVTITGTVNQSIKLGKLSGYTLKDEAGDSIGVKSEILPTEGKEISVTGVMMKDTLLGYYLQAES